MNGDGTGFLRARAGFSKQLPEAWIWDQSFPQNKSCGTKRFVAKISKLLCKHCTLAQSRVNLLMKIGKFSLAVLQIVHFRKDYAE